VSITGFKTVFKTGTAQKEGNLSLGILGSDILASSVAAPESLLPALPRRIVMFPSRNGFQL
jgi:hypothetical protein